MFLYDSHTEDCTPASVRSQQRFFIITIYNV